MDHNYFRTKKIYTKAHRECKVPSCLNNSSMTPEKLFLRVPLSSNVRQKWLAAAGLFEKAISRTSDHYFCEDHFVLEEDLENYMAYKMGFLKRIRIKEGHLPSKFSCQEEEPNPLVNAVVEMDVIKGQNILAIETVANKSNSARSGLIIRVGEDVLYKSSFAQEEEECDSLGNYQTEYYKFINPILWPDNLKTKIVCDKKVNLVNEIALCKDHDYCKKLV